MNGLIKQKGIYTPVNTNLQTINYLVPFSQVPTVFAQPRNNTNDTQWNVLYIDRIESVTVSYFKVQAFRFAPSNVTPDDTELSWEAMGF